MAKKSASTKAQLPTKSIEQRRTLAKRVVPLHFQVFTKLRNGIFRGEYPELTALPGEASLGAKFGVSRITVRRALDELAARGLVERAQGRPTTVRARPTFSPVIADVNGSLERNVLISLETKGELIEFSYVPAPIEVAKDLNLAHGAKVQMAVRIRMRDSMPFAHVTSWIPERIGRLFAPRDLARTSVLDLLEQHGISIRNVEQTISADVANRAVAKALKIAVGAPVLKVERTVYGGDGFAAEASRAIYPADRHQYRINLRPSALRRQARLSRPGALAR